jgi:hypothetical protein
MLLSTRRVCLPTLKVAAFVSALSYVAVAQGQESKPFAGMGGNWSGSGRISVSGGINERIRCRARYDVGKTGTTVDLRLRCASDSYKFELQSNVSYQNGQVSGNWTETTFGISGRLTGSVKPGGQIDVRVESSSFSALMSVKTSGNRQSISIKAAGREMSESNITLSRG